MNTDIFYFSGTGNSLFVAKELQKRIPESKIIPVVGLMQKNKIESSADKIGFVFPVHALTIPIVIRKFIKKLNITNGKYIFAIATREGTVFRGFDAINRLLKAKNRHLSAHTIVCMHNNDTRHGIPGQKYTPPTKDQILAREKIAIEQIDIMKDIIIQQDVYLEKDTTYTQNVSTNPILSFLIEKLVIFLMNFAELFGGVNYFYYDEKCTGCGICEKVCLSKKIKLQDNKPIWRRDILCYMCFACLNFCPKESVQIKDIPGVKSYTKVNGRYNHPYATVQDISNQKYI